MHRSRILGSLFLFSVLVLTACQGGASQAPEAAASPAPTDLPLPTNSAPPTSTTPPTVIPTETPAEVSLEPGQCIELLENGDFETGSVAPWTETTKAKPTLLVEFPGARGKFSGFLGGGSGLEESLYQQVEIPSSAATVTLTYWWMHGSHEDDGKAHDFLKVILQDASGKELAVLEEISNITPPDRQFAQSTQDLTAYIGQSGRLEFHVITDAQNDSDFFVDDVSLQACGPK